MTIRAFLLAAAACLCLAGCNTSSPEEGGVLSSLGVPMLKESSCADVSAEAAALSARAFTSVGLPPSPQREGPNGMAVIPWPDIPGDDGLSAERAAIRSRAEAGNCSLAFRVSKPVDVEANAPVTPTLPVEVTPLGEPAPATPAAVDATATRLPDVPAEHPRAPAAPRSAWDADPRPVGVAAGGQPGVDGINPAVAPPPPKPVVEVVPAKPARRQAAAKDAPRQRPSDR